jgi:hypothetical protein
MTAESIILMLAIAHRRPTHQIQILYYNALCNTAAKESDSVKIRAHSLRLKKKKKKRDSLQSHIMYALDCTVQCSRRSVTVTQ